MFLFKKMLFVSFVEKKKTEKKNSLGRRSIFAGIIFGEVLPVTLHRIFLQRLPAFWLAVLFLTCHDIEVLRRHDEWHGIFTVHHDV